MTEIPICRLMAYVEFVLDVLIESRVRISELWGYQVALQCYVLHFLLFFWPGYCAWTELKKEAAAT